MVAFPEGNVLHKGRTEGRLLVQGDLLGHGALKSGLPGTIGRIHRRIAQVALHDDRPWTHLWHRPGEEIAQSGDGVRVMKLRLAGSGKERQPGDRAPTGAREQTQQRYVRFVDGV